jgi:glyoxylase-like metal-dependent hydrolase (beta-lactamase superfamily II)
MQRLRWLAIISVALVPGLVRAEDLFTLKQVVPGVYAALAKEQYEINCNAAVILLDESVLVVDTHSKPSAARALIAQIKAVTDKPVRYVVNTHFHWDHYLGNQAYVGAWPAGVEIISSEATREGIEQRGIPRVKRALLDTPKEIAQLQSDLAAATDPAEKAKIRENLRQAQAYLVELQNMQVTLPTLTFDRSVILHQKTRTVEILWLGKAHTDGDVVVYLPNEKFIATGDMLHGWVPYMGDGYPYDWIQTLTNAEKLDFEWTLGGHGDVMHGKATFELWRAYLRDLMEATADAFAQGATQAEARKTVAARLLPKYADRFPPGMLERDVAGNIDKAYRVVSASQE